MGYMVYNQSDCDRDIGFYTQDNSRQEFAPHVSGESRIRTLEGRAGGFTVRSHWPLGQPARVVLVIRREQVTLITALGANQGRQSAVDSPIIYGQSE